MRATGKKGISRGGVKGKEGWKEGRRSWHSLACRLLRVCSPRHPVTVVWLKDSGQAVTCLDCKYRGRGDTLSETLPKPKLKWHLARAVYDATKTPKFNRPALSAIPTVRFPAAEDPRTCPASPSKIEGENTSPTAFNPIGKQ